MPNDLLTVSMSLSLLALSAVLIGLFAILIQALRTQAEALRELRRDVLPALTEMRQTSQNLLAASEGLRQGVQQVQHLTHALGEIGEDLDLGHRTVKGGIKLAGKLLVPWLGKLMN